MKKVLLAISVLFLTLFSNAETYQISNTLHLKICQNQDVSFTDSTIITGDTIAWRLGFLNGASNGYVMYGDTLHKLNQPGTTGLYYTTSQFINYWTIDTIQAYVTKNGVTDTVTIRISIYEKPDTQKICQVSLNLNNFKNVITWESNINQRVDHFDLYRDDNFYTSISSNVSEFTDVNSDPNSFSYSYKIKTVDSCGIESEFSATHKTIKLYVNSSPILNDVNLNWTPYAGNASFNGYYFLMKKSSSDTSYSIVIDSISSTSMTYHNHNLGDSYLIGTFISGCSGARSLTYIYSNSLNFNSTSINSITSEKIGVYPNPSSGNVTIDGAKGTMKIFNELSQQVFEKENISEKETINLSTGVYFVKFENTGETKKLVIK